MTQIGLTQGTGANVLFRAESRLAGLEAQQAQKLAVGAGDRGPPPPGGDHRPVHFIKAGSGRHGTACESPKRRSGNIKKLAIDQVVTFHNSLQVPRRADDQRRVDVVVVEEVAYLTDRGRQRMPRGSREHLLGSSARDLIHRSRIRTVGWSWSPAIPTAAPPPAAAFAMSDSRQR